MRLTVSRKPNSHLCGAVPLSRSWQRFPSQWNKAIAVFVVGSQTVLNNQFCILSIWVYLQTRRNLRSVDMRNYQTCRSQRISDPCGNIPFQKERAYALYQFQSLFICVFEFYLTMFSKAFFCTTRSSEYFGVLIGCAYLLVKGCEEKNNSYSE